MLNRDPDCPYKIVDNRVRSNHVEKRGEEHSQSSQEDVYSGDEDSCSFDYDSDSDFKDEEEGLRYTLHVEIPEENKV